MKLGPVAMPARRHGDLAGTGAGPDPRVRARAPARAGVSRVAVLLAAALLLSWVALLNRSPLVFSDTRAYVVGGEVAWDKAAALAGSLAAPSAQVPGEDRHGAAVRGAVGVRSAYYGLFAFLSRGGGWFWPTVALQALALAFAARAFLAAAFPAVGERGYLALAGGLAAVSAAPWFASFLMPDVFAGVAILCVATLGLYRDRVPGPSRWALMALLCFSAAAHNSILLVVGLSGMAVAAGAVIGRWPARRALASVAAILGPFLLAVAAGLAVGIIGFKQVTLAPQAPPFLLARSIEDGPGRLYLQSRCPEAGYWMCRHAGSLPAGSQEFLWSPTGVFMSATPEERARMRAEQMDIVLSAAAAYPREQALASLSNFARQLLSFGVGDLTLGQGPRYGEDGFRVVESWPGGAGAGVMAGMGVVIQAGVAVSVLAMALLARRGEFRDKAPLLALLGLAILANAFVCGVLSDPQPRYQARVMWLLPLVAGAMLLSRRPHTGHGPG